MEEEETYKPPSPQLPYLRTPPYNPTPRAQDSVGRNLCTVDEFRKNETPTSYVSIRPLNEL